MKIDIMRRSRLFIDAVGMIDAQPLPKDEFLVAILNFERQLSQAEDDTPHTVDEAIAAFEPGMI